MKDDIGDSLKKEDKKSKKKKGKSKQSAAVADSDDDEFDDEIEIVIEEKDKGSVVNDEDFVSNTTKSKTIESGTVIFEVGDEEQELLELSKFVEGKIPEDEWDEIATGSNLDKYVVQEGDWLWKISQNLFGSGFYYSKVWALNPHITNPHEIEPGMTLVFDTGNSDSLPNVKFGKFSENPNVDIQSNAGKVDFDFSDFGEGTKPPWIEERDKLRKSGVYFQFASEETYNDLAKIGQAFLTTEHEKYEPPITEIIVEEPGDSYDDTGFDKESRVVFDVKEGFFLNTFVTSNIVQDLGEIEALKHEGVFVQKFDTVYVKFDRSVKVKPGDTFSVYNAAGKAEHKVSDRSGFRYSITAQIETVRKINQVWECVVKELTGLVERKDRVTVFTPKINKITKTFNKRNIEAAVIEAYNKGATSVSFGDVVYLDRGRADGVEMGNVFEVYEFRDRGTGRKITPDPTYKIGELTVITLTDNFSTALVTQSKSEFGAGQLALTKTQEDAARDSRVKNRTALGEVKLLEKNALDELDVELNLDDISQDLLEKADRIQLTEDELEELERQEREKSIIKGHEQDLQELERLEKEIVEAETALNESKVDEDKFLEQEDLNAVEKNSKSQDPNAFESLNEIEQEVGRKYIDEDLNSKENPYGLTEFDLEEIDELLNTESL